MRTRHVLAATAALALVGSTAGAALAGASAASAPQGQADRRRRRQAAGRPAQRRPGAATAPATGPTASPACSTSRRPAGQPTVVFASKKARAPTASRPTAACCASPTGVQRQQGRRGLDPRRHRRRRSAARRHLRRTRSRRTRTGSSSTASSTRRSPASRRLRRRSRARTPGHKETHPYAVPPPPTASPTSPTPAPTRSSRSRPPACSPPSPALKPVKVTITRRLRQANGAAGVHWSARSYAVEAVPTDVEVGPDGKLYVTSLPGGPEDPSLGANGRVLRIDPATGKVTTVVGGLISPDRRRGGQQRRPLRRPAVPRARSRRIKAGKSQGEDLPRR